MGPVRETVLLQLESYRARTGLGQRVLLVLLHCLIASVWLQKQAKRHPPGWSRLLVALPVIVLNMTVPLLIDPASEVCTGAAVAFQLVWLSSFKVHQSYVTFALALFAFLCFCFLLCCFVVHFDTNCCVLNVKMFESRSWCMQVLGLCLNRGPLCNPLNLVQFFAVFTLPITPQAILKGVEAITFLRVCTIWQLLALAVQLALLAYTRIYTSTDMLLVSTLSISCRG